MWLVEIDGVVQWARIGPDLEIEKNPEYTGQKKDQEETGEEVNKG